MATRRQARCRSPRTRGARATPALRWLYLTGNPIGDGIGAIRSCPSLHEVSAESCGLGHSAIRAFADLPKLQELYPWDTTLAGAPDWRGLAHLTELNLVGVVLTPEKLVEVGTLLPRVVVVG